MKINKWNVKSSKFKSMYKNERKEHPSFSDKEIVQIVKDHIKIHYKI